MVGDLSLGYLVDTTMQRGYRVPISLFIATHSVFTQMWEVLATLRLRGRPARDGCQVHCETVLGDAFSTSPQICSPKQSHNALWQLSRPGLPRNFKWRIDHFRLLKSLTFKIRPSAQPFLWKWVLFTWEWKLISISKAEHLTSFWYRGLGELENGLLPAKKSVVLPEDLTIACEFCFCIPSASAYLLVSLVPNNHFRQGFRWVPVSHSIFWCTFKSISFGSCILP